MAWRPRPRRMQLDGADAVVLTPDDYERLDSIRRQAGAQSVRIHGQRERLAAATALLEQITRAVAHADCTACTGEHAAGCLRETLRAILATDAARSPDRLCGGQPRSEPQPDRHQRPDQAS